ncbi:MAG: PorP/SprF family type IX secretion system membrane protein [Prevotellaceae bacterium]|jgi:type IX secretion system PorP/SprF family membrane protein|nr:PorP/SprF family type IX secretion system membrane protein [Prevotellaceae bacterium]
MAAILISISSLFAEVLAQDVYFSQPYTMPTYLNPAYTGLEGHVRVGLSYRNQWTSLESPYVTYAVYADSYFDNFKSGVGLIALSDRQGRGGGTFIKNTIGASYAYNLQIAEKTFARFGLQAMVKMNSVKGAELIFPDMIDLDGNIIGEAGFSRLSKAVFNMAIGGVFSHDWLYAGIALHNLIGTTEAAVLEEEVNTLIKYTVSLGCNIPITLYNQSSRGTTYRNVAAETLTISPNIIHQHQGKGNILNVGSYFGLMNFALGVFYKHGFGTSSNYYSVNFSYKTSLFTITYNFDFGNVSRETKTSAANTHEVSLIVRMKHQESRRGTKYRTIPYRANNTPDV